MGGRLDGRIARHGGEQGNWLRGCSAVCRGGCSSDPTARTVGGLEEVDDLVRERGGECDTGSAGPRGIR